MRVGYSSSQSERDKEKKKKKNKSVLENEIFSIMEKSLKTALDAALDVCPDRIEAYIDDELFWNAVRDSYKSIDLSGRNKRDMERFLAKHKKTADWLRKQANGIYF